VPSIGTRVGGVPEAISEGKTGLLVSPGDPPALARAISKLYTNPELRRRLGEAARHRAKTTFTESIMATRYMEALTQ
jgi:glycosyltransferase involved in cell wall biosynthesis